jgi:hypothetical protein
MAANASGPRASSNPAAARNVSTPRQCGASVGAPSSRAARTRRARLTVGRALSPGGRQPPPDAARQRSGIGQKGDRGAQPRDAYGHRAHCCSSSPFPFLFRSSLFWPAVRAKMGAIGGLRVAMHMPSGEHLSTEAPESHGRVRRGRCGSCDRLHSSRHDRRTDGAAQEWSPARHRSQAANSRVNGQ